MIINDVQAPESPKIAGKFYVTKPYTVTYLGKSLRYKGKERRGKAKARWENFRHNRENLFGEICTY